MYSLEDQERWMAEALKEAHKAYAIEEIPIGAVLVKDGQIIGRGYNYKEHSQRATHHAEIRAIEDANDRLGHWRLEGAALFVTVEPCLMCAGAILNARIDELYFGAYDLKGGAAGTLMHVLDDDRLNHQTSTVGGVLEAACSQLMSDFFRELRMKRKAEKEKRARLDKERNENDARS